jgi:capsular polysaccharide biosynthesis protein
MSPTPFQFSPYEAKEFDLYPEIPYFQIEKKVVVDPRTGLAFRKDGTPAPISENAYLINNYGEKREWVRKDNKKSIETRITERRIAAEAYYAKIKGQPIIELPPEFTYVNLLSPVGNYTYGHILENVLRLLELPALENLCCLVSSLKTIPHLGYWIQKLAPYPQIKILEIPNSVPFTYQCKTLVELKPQSGIVNFANEKQHQEVIKRLVPKECPSSNFGKKIFLTRNAPLSRHILNFDVLKQALEAAGVTIFYGNEPGRERIYAMSQATHISGYHGGAFLDTLFCNENARILEYCSTKKHAKCFLRLYKRSTHFYQKLVKTEDDYNAILPIEEILEFYNTEFIPKPEPRTGPKATIISVYTGPFPASFPLTKKTIQHNKDYEWIIATDNVETPYKEGNITFLPYTLKDLNRDCSDILGEPIEIQTPYKIAETKPLWPVIFKPQTEWTGWCDLDMIFGDFESFFTPETWDNFDIITYAMANGDVYGPLTLLRAPVIPWYKFIENYPYKLNTQPSPEKINYAVDEIDFGKIIQEQNYRVKTKQPSGLPLVFTGKRRAPAHWKDGKIYVDSIQEDYNGKYPDTHSLCLHIRKNHVVDIASERILTQAESALLNTPPLLEIQEKISTSKLISQIIPTLKFLKRKIPELKLRIHTFSYTKTLADLLALFAPEITAEIYTGRSLGTPFTQFLTSDEIPPAIITEMQALIPTQACQPILLLNTKTKLDKKLQKEFTDFEVLKVEELGISQLAMIFKNAPIVAGTSCPEFGFLLVRPSHLPLMELCNGHYPAKFHRLACSLRKLFSRDWNHFLIPSDELETYCNREGTSYKDTPNTKYEIASPPKFDEATPFKKETLKPYIQKCKLP